ncbi:MAG TPA: methyltransferase domain-containing protein [Tepidisphaeraceae bacterium]|nr:methyltransferase domain-containing protein [Tepidisphaeraceae bacterium]
MYNRAHAFVYQAAADLVDLLAPQPGEMILDLGCGTGPLASRVAGAGATVLGIDSSPAMIEAARAGFPKLDFRVADARSFRTDTPLDAVFSNATLHWVRPPAEAVETIWLALKPGGRFVAEFGAQRNVLAVRTAMEAALREMRIDPTGLSPWYFPSPGEYATLLEAQGFEVGQIASFPRFTKLEGADGLRNWIRMFASAYLTAVPEGQRDAFLSRAEDLARPTLFRDDMWHADYRRLRVAAVRPS